jgi:uncharacterized protein with von Willebrand factor type A (vWA) domain
MSAVSADLVEHPARFCRRLRAEGLPLGPGDTLDATRALGSVDLVDREDVRLGLRATLVKRVEDAPLFDALFESFWSGPAPVPRNPPVVPPDADEDSEGPASISPRRRSVHAFQDLEELAIPAPSSREALGRQDFASFGEEELRAVTTLARRIARRLSARPGRRWKLSRRGEQVSLRRTVREALKTGGELSTLTWRRRKLRRTRLVILADVSGSMDLYARLLLQFLYALQNAFSRVETFVFATRLSRVTDELRAPGYRAALGNLSDRVQDWSGGTRIGESLTAFLSSWPRLVDRRTVVVVLSDGWETGDPDVLGEALALLHRRAGRLVWLNPLLGSPGYEPLTRGMQAALPHLDVFAPANDLASLEQLARHLSL